MSTWLISLLMGAMLGQVPHTQPAGWQFDPNYLQLENSQVTASLRPLGAMHGVVIDKLKEDGSPTAQGRAFLNLEHYLERGRSAEYLPRELDHVATLTRDCLSILFPRPKDWPVESTLKYTFEQPGAIDANLAFSFSGKLSQFEVYFTSYFAPQYQRFVKIGGEWIRPKIGPKEQLLIPRDNKIAGRYADGRWDFLKGRTRLADYRFDLPIIISRDPKTDWAVAQMVEPGACTHIAPNLFAVGHNFIIGGWDVKKGDKRHACVRLIAGYKLSNEQVEKAYEVFAEQCRKKGTRAAD